MTVPPDIIRVHHCSACGRLEVRPDHKSGWSCPRCLTPNMTPVTFANVTIDGTHVQPKIANPEIDRPTQG